MRKYVAPCVAKVSKNEEESPALWKLILGFPLVVGSLYFIIVALLSL